MSELREALAAAMKGDEQGDGVASAAPETPIIEAPITTPAEGAPEGAAATGQTPEPEAPKPEDGALKRDETGRFAKMGEPEQLAKTETVKPAAVEPPPGETTRIPPSLPAAVKAKFSTLDPDVRDAFVKLEDSVQTAKAEWGNKGQRLNRFDEIFAPRREKLQLSGLDEFTAIQTLFAAQDLLERSPLEGLQYLARSYGVDLRQLGAQTSQPGQGFQPQPQGQPGAQGPNPYLDQALQPLMQQVQTLQSQLTQQQEAARLAELNQGLAEINAFRSDPANLYFDNVRDHIAGLIEGGQAKTLKDAYDMACWANPEIRGLLQQAQQQEQQKQAAAAQAKAKATADAQAKAAASAKAAGSVTGAPGSTVAAVNTGSKGSVRADLEAAIGERSAQV